MISPTAASSPARPSGTGSGTHTAAQAKWHRPRAPGRTQSGRRSSSSASLFPDLCCEHPAQRPPVNQRPLCPPPSCSCLTPCSSTAFLSRRLCPAWICWGVAPSIRPPLPPPALHLWLPQFFQTCHRAALRGPSRGSRPCPGRFWGSWGRGRPLRSRHRCLLGWGGRTPRAPSPSSLQWHTHRLLVRIKWWLYYWYTITNY